MTCNIEKGISQENWIEEDARMTTEWMYERFGVDERPAKPEKRPEMVLFDAKIIQK